MGEFQYQSKWNNQQINLSWIYYWLLKWICRGKNGERGELWTIAGKINVEEIRIIKLVKASERKGAIQEQRKKNRDKYSTVCGSLINRLFSSNNLSPN